MTDETPVKPHLEIHENPVKGAGFSHYEIQTVREYCDAGGEHYFEVYTDNTVGCDEYAVGEVLYGIYGRSYEGGAQWLLDCRTLKDAQDVLASMIGGEATRKANESIRDAARSLVADIDAMRCELPYDFEINSEADKQHWFGKFSYYDSLDSEVAIQWPNLSILSEKLNQLANS